MITQVSVTRGDHPPTPLMPYFSKIYKLHAGYYTVSCIPNVFVCVISYSSRNGVRRKIRPR